MHHLALRAVRIHNCSHLVAVSLLNAVPEEREMVGI